MMGFLFNYCPWINRVRFILQWVFEIIRDQVNPTYARFFVPPSLWPGWDWAKMNALECSRKSPWIFSWIHDDDYDDDYDDANYCNGCDCRIPLGAGTLCRDCQSF